MCNFLFSKNKKKVAKTLADSKFCTTFANAIREQHLGCKVLKNGALVQLVRIRACHARGQGFESPTHRQFWSTDD